jgi:methionine synthase II (cobalamin-independent)
MSETLTLNDAPADQPELNADEQESLAVAEANEGEQQQLLAGKFQDTQSLEQAYLALQKKLGEPDEQEDVQEEASGKLTEQQANQLFDMVGGESTYKDMLNWAAESFSKEEIEMYDSVMADGNANAIFFAVQALNSKYTDAVGKDGQLLTGKRSAAQQNEQFRSQQELVQAMSDPRYDRDPAFRDDIIRKLQNSDIDF